MTAAAPTGVDSGAGAVEFFEADNAGTDPSARARADAHMRNLQDVARLIAFRAAARAELLAVWGLDSEQDAARLAMTRDRGRWIKP